MRSFPVLMLLLIVAGCGENRHEFMATYESISEAATERYGTESQLVFESREQLEEFVHTQVERLGSASWQKAWILLRAAGSYSVEPLIGTLGDRATASATVKALPGAITPGERIFITRGEVAYALLREIIGEYSNYRGQLPPNSQEAWEKWWRANSRNLQVQTRAVIKPGKG